MFYSCVSIPVIKPLSMKNLGAKPEKGIITTVDVGSSIYSEYDYTTNPVAILSHSFSYKGMEIQAGKEFNGMIIDGIETYCINEMIYGSTYPCLSDSNRDGSFDKVMDISSMTNSRSLLNENIPYTLTTSRYNDGKGFMLELLYQGVSDNNIQVSYREFQNNMARPAFTQEVKYQLNTDGKTIIGFKGARIEVIKATNVELSYIVIKGFDLN
jgi:hypothetical protein